MKTISLLILCSLFIYSCSPQLNSVKDEKGFVQLYKQYQDKDYFKFRKNLESNTKQLSNDHYQFCIALMHHVFNDQEQSNYTADLVLKNEKSEVADSLLYQLYQIKRMNHINLYEYLEAAEISYILLDNYSTYADSVELQNLKNELKIWEALSSIPKQQINRVNDVLIPMYKDKVNLMNINCVFGSDSIPFIFDTGANFSVIKRSLVEKLKIKLIESDFYVTAATGNKVKSSLAIADQFYIEGIKIENAVFLVFDDKDLSFPDFDYFPNGAIGFPIIEAFEEIQLNNNGSILVPELAQNYQLNNLALDGLMPIIAVEYQDDTLNFNFDTGGRNTTMYHGFYSKYQSEIDQFYTPQSFTAGSGGGNKDFEGFVLDSISFSIAGSKAAVYDVRLHKDPVFEGVEKIHGNFGQDYINQFKRMIISFKSASIFFTDPVSS